MKNLFIYILIFTTCIFLLLTGCDDSGSDSFSTLTESTHESVIEGYLFKSLSLSSSPLKTDALIPNTSEESFSGVRIVVEGTMLETVTDSTGYFKISTTNRNDLGFRMLRFTNVTGNVDYGSVALNYYENDQRLYRVKVFGDKKTEVIELDTNDKNKVVNRAPIVDAGADIYTSHLNNDPIMIYTERSYDPDQNGRIKSVAFDFNDDNIFDFEDVFRSRYAFSKGMYFSSPGSYVVNVKMVDNMGGIGLDTLNVFVDFEYSHTNIRPLAYIKEPDNVSDGVIIVSGGAELSLIGYGIDYDAIPNIPMTYNWNQVEGSDVVLNTSIDTSETIVKSILKFLPISGNTYKFSFTASDDYSTSIPAYITVRAGENTGGDTGGDVISGVADGFLYYEADNVIYRLNTQSGVIVNLTDGSFKSTTPSPSADYGSVYFSSNRDSSQNYDLYSMTKNGGSAVRITQTESSENINRDEFSPVEAVNGRVYFAYGNKLSSISSSGGDLRTEIEFDGKLIKTPDIVITETDAKIAFVSNKNTVSDFELYIADIDNDGRIINPENLDAHNVSNGNNDYSPKFSKDGKYLVFFRKDSSGNGDIYKLDVETDIVIKLTDDVYDNRYPCFSTDGSKVFYVSDRDDDSGIGEIWVMNSDGTDKLKITDNNIKERFLSFGE